MANLTDERIESLARCASTAAEIDMAKEILRRRAEQAAGREHVERVVREAVVDALDGCGGPAAVAQVGWDAARRVADRLSAPVLSKEERDVILKLYMMVPAVTAHISLTAEQKVILARLLDGASWLIAGAKP